MTSFLEGCISRTRAFIEREKVVLLSVFSISILAYAAELGTFTFSTDYYQVFLIQAGPFTTDGRWFANFVYGFVFGHAQTPSLNLICFSILRILASVKLIHLWGEFRVEERILGSSIIAIHPFFIENISYSFLTHLGLAIFLGVVALQVAVRGALKSMFLGAILVMLSLASYQTGMNFAIAGFCVLLAFKLFYGATFSDVVRREVLGFGVAVVAGTLFYGVSLYVESQFHTLSRLKNKGGLAVGVVLDNLRSTMDRAVEYVAVDQTFFPLALKIVGVALLTWAMFLIARNALRERRIPAGLAIAGLVAASLLASASTMIALKGFGFSHCYRVMYPFAVFSCGVFLFATRGGMRSRLLVTVLGSVLIFGFIVQNQKAHYYLEVKNKIEWSIVNRMVDRLQQQPGYHDGMPFVIIGTLKDYVPEPFAVGRKSGLRMGPLEVLSYPYSVYRAFYPLLSFENPTPQHRRIATRYAERHEPWPAPGSVGIEKGVAILVLSKPRSQ